MLPLTERLRRVNARVRKEMNHILIDECRHNVNRRAKGVPEISKDEIAKIVLARAEALYGKFCASQSIDNPPEWDDAVAKQRLTDFMRGFSDGYINAPNAKAAGYNVTATEKDEKIEELKKKKAKAKKIVDDLEAKLKEDKKFQEALAYIKDKGYDVSLESSEK